jgi:hypothetical protein
MLTLNRFCAAALVALSLTLGACHDDAKETVVPTITAPASIGNGVVGVAFAPTSIMATGTAPITFAVTAGTLPPGITLDATGQYAGTPTTAGVFNFTVSATNRRGSGSQAFSQTILQRPAITAPASPLAPGIAGAPAAAIAFTASGSTPVTWSVSTGSLPSGMTLDAATGAYNGTPTATGVFSFTITATNSVGADSEPFMQTVTAPAVNAHALVGGNSIAAFATTFAPGLEAPLPLLGVNAGETIVSIDRRPQNGFLYGLGFNPTAGSVQLYSISTVTGFATAIGSSGAFVGADGVTPVPVGAGAGTTFGIDFNPTVDRVRVVNGAGQNFRMNPNSGAFVDGNAGIAGVQMDGGINGATTTVQETAYTNSAPGTAVTTQYAIDSAIDAVCIQSPPNNGTQTMCQTLSTPVEAVVGFDIAPQVTVATSNTPAAGSGIGVLRLGGAVAESLATIDLANGVVGTPAPLGSGGIQGLALHTPAAIPFVGLSADGAQLVRFTSAAPGTATTVAITGVVAGDTLAGVDFRPQTGQLYALGVNDAANSATLYLVDPQTAVASAVGAAGQVAFVDMAGNPVDLPAASIGYGFDFNPTVDRVRVTTNTGLNFRVNPNNGAPVDGNLNNAAAPPAGINTDGLINGLPVDSTGVAGAAYTNSYGQPLGVGFTTQYALDSVSDLLFAQVPPNSGTLVGGVPLTVNGLKIDFTAVNGFDIPSDVQVTASNTPANGTAYAALMVGNVQMLYAIDILTGRTTAMGSLTMPLGGLAVGQIAVK